MYLYLTYKSVTKTCETEIRSYQTDKFMLLYQGRYHKFVKLALNNKLKKINLYMVMSMVILEPTD